MYIEYYKSSATTAAACQTKTDKKPRGSMGPQRLMGKKYRQADSTNLVFLVFVNASLYQRYCTLKVPSVMDVRELRLFVDSERVLGGKLLNSKS
jgi:hypothetical protein